MPGWLIIVLCVGAGGIALALFGFVRTSLSGKSRTSFETICGFLFLFFLFFGHRIPLQIYHGEWDQLANNLGHIVLAFATIALGCSLLFGAAWLLERIIKGRK